MSNTHSEVEVLKEELNFLTGLLQGHRTHGAYYPKPQFSSVPYCHPSIYNRKMSVKSTNLNSLSIYKSKYHANNSSFKNHCDDRTGQVFMPRSVVHKPASVPVYPKQSFGYNAKQDDLWKHQVPSSSFKIVRTSDNAKVTNADSKTCAVPSNAAVVASAIISSVDNTRSSKMNKSSIEVAEVGNILKRSCERISSKKDQPQEKNVTSKHPKAPKVSYVTCSDCIIEISEYENGELEITQKKLDSSFQDNESAFIGISPSPVETPKFSWNDTVDEKDLPKELSETVCADEQHTSGHNCVFEKHPCESDSSKAAVSNVETDIKLSNTSSSSTGKCVFSLCKFKTQHPFVKNVKYSKVNDSASKSQNSVAKHILKNKYSVKKSNVVKCKINKELKGCTAHPTKYPHRSTSQKYLVNYSAKRTVLLPVKNLNKRNTYTSYSNLNFLRQGHARSKVTKSSFPALSYAKVSKKTKALHMQSAYKVVNKRDLLTGNHSSDKKWFKSNNGAIAFPHCNLSAVAQQSMTKSETKKVLHCSVLHNTSNCELKSVLNTSKIISRHSLQGIVPKKGFTKKTSFSPSAKSFSDSHTSTKKAKVRLSKTAYKVVNRYANHVSQVVQMIKTKYRTVNKRSASNSHLKWLQEQKRAYLARKLGKPLQSHTKTGWTYCRHSSAVHHTRKPPVLLSKASRKHSPGQSKVFKNICGVTYKVSKTQIKKSFTPKRIKKSHFTLCNNKNSVIVNVHGTKFQMSPGGKSLKRLGINKGGNQTSLRRIKVGGFTYVQQKEGSGCLLKYSSTTQNVASRMLHRSINTVRAAEARKTLRKNNIFCMFFNRFGRCNKEGNCPYIHDPSKIAVCTRFLRGTCKNSRCPFSHEISPGKMAVCSFFLQGNCTNCDCPYRHTSISPDTRLCKAFVKGYCDKGNECQDAHILACPQFICEGFCEKGSSCMWPHPPVKNRKKRSDPPKVNNEIKEKDASAEDISDQRYFSYEPGSVLDKCVKLTESVVESICTSEKIPKVRNKKIAFPKQPEFIPL